MATLQSFITLLPAIFQNRYTASGHFVSWANELLEELQDRGFLSTTIKEVGVLVEKDKWIDKPYDFLKFEKVWYPNNPDYQLRVEDVNNKLKLKDKELEIDDTDWVAITGFSNYATGSLTLDYTGKTPVEINELENSLLLITSGTSAGLGIIIYENTATETNLTDITFLHDLDSALSATKIVSAKIVPSDQYLMMKYVALINEVTSVDDEMPIPTDVEKRLIPTYLRWCCERQAMATSNETSYWGNEKDKLLYSIQSSRLSVPIKPVKGRRLVGMESCSYPIVKSHPDYSEF